MSKIINVYHIIGTIINNYTIVNTRNLSDLKNENNSTLESNSPQNNSELIVEVPNELDTHFVIGLIIATLMIVAIATLCLICCLIRSNKSLLKINIDINSFD